MQLMENLFLRLEGNHNTQADGQDVDEATKLEQLKTHSPLSDDCVKANSMA